MATGDSLFRLTRLIAATDIKLSARCENGQKQILAFVTESGHLTLYYKPTPQQLPVMKIVPWFSDSVKRIAALTFDPSGTWLLVAGHDGTVYIVPALPLLDPSSPSLDHRWPPADITPFPTSLSAPPSPASCRISRPTAVAWWQCGSDCQHVAVVGTDRGDVVFVSLTAGAQVGTTHVRAPIAEVQVCQDNSLDAVFLLVTSDQRHQWKLLLEQRASGYVWPLDNIINSRLGDFSTSQSSLDLELSGRNAPLPTTRSRLQGLKQLSVEKLASLRLRLAETRVKGAMDRDGQMRRGSNSSSSDESLSRGRRVSPSSSTEGPDWSSTGPLPETLGPYVGETYLQPQYARGRHLLSGYYAPNNILTIHGMNLEVVPLFVHKLPPRSRTVLVTDRFLFVSDEARRRLSVVSCQLAESRLDGDTDFNPESVVDAFDLDGDERIIAVYKRTDSSLRVRANSRSKSSNSNHRSSAERRDRGSAERRDKTSESGEKTEEPDNGVKVSEKILDTREKWENKEKSSGNREKSSDNREKVSDNREKSSENRVKTSENRDKSSERRERERSTGKGRASREREAKRPPQFVLPKDVSELNVEEKLADTCVLVTTAGVYEVMLRRPAVAVFMELVLQRQELERAERLAQMFALDLPQLFEAAGDLKLADRQFPQAISLYKLSRCRHLKSVLKFAAAGHSRELLAYVGMLLSTAGVELSPSERIHLANLAVMAYTDQVLRAVHRPRAALTKQFLEFLRWNLHYDEVLAVNIAGQTGLWEILRYLAASRGLHPEVLDILAKILRSLGDPGDPATLGESSPALDAGLWSCVAHPSLLQALLARPQPARTHLAFVARLLPALDAARLARLAALLDPSAPALRPALRRAVLATRRRRHRSAVSGSDSYQSDSPENDEVCLTSPAEEIVQAFLLVLLRLIRARTREDPGAGFDPRLVGRLKSPATEEDLITFMETSNVDHCVPLRTSVIGAGFCHAALVRNATVFTWGNAVQGCLGTGPTMSRYSLPQHVALFPTLRVEVLSVACGRQHTLALTTNGVYAWGSSQYGQLGVGADVSQSAWPALVVGLAEQRVVAVAAGQYHSLALTSDGRVYSWGWGVHGQLGHGSVEDCHEPRAMLVPCGATVLRVAAGHAHSVMLARGGQLWACGSGMFGQLGGGGTAKSTAPVRVAGVGEAVVDVATGYFHNLAVTASNRLYSWGASPQVLRLQAQAQKKARLMREHCAARTPTSPPATPPRLADGLESTVIESLIADLPSPVAAVLPVVGDIIQASQVDGVIGDTLDSALETLTNMDASEVVLKATDKKATVAVAKKSFTQSVHDYFMEQKASLMEPTQKSATKKPTGENNLGSGGTEMTLMDRSEVRSAKSAVKVEPKSASRRGNECGGGTEMVVMEGRGREEGAAQEEEEVPMWTNVRTASSEGYVLPTIVISPTIEARKAPAAKKAVPPAAPKKPPQKPPPYLLDEGVQQAHLLPQLVDTSLVVGPIVQIACGCHHSALVTKDGTLYTWGRNLDGQLGTGGRREVAIPTPLGLTPPPAAAPATPTSPAGEGGRAAIASAIPPTAGDKLRVQQVVCGCEFTAALDIQSAKLWAWGSNSHAQVGRAPVEDGKCLDGRTVMIKSVKRVIKLPHGSQNAVETPREVLHLPAAGITFRPPPRDPLPPAPLAPLAAMDAPAYGAATLHYLLQRLRGHYDAALTARRCIDAGNYQAAARLAAMERQYHEALEYQLRALEAASPRDERISEKSNAENVNGEGPVYDGIERDSRDGSERDAKLNAQNLIGDGGERFAKVDCDISVQSDGERGRPTRDMDCNENVVDVNVIEDSRLCLQKGDVYLGETAVFNGEAKRNGDISVQSEPRAGSCLVSSEGRVVDSENHFSDPEIRLTDPGNRISELDSRPEDPENQLSDPRNRFADTENKLVDPESRVSGPESRSTEPESRVLSPESRMTTPESVLSSPSEDPSEIHAFSVQGGNEEMSEGRQDLTSPSDTASPPPSMLEEGEREGEGAGPGESTAESIAAADLENNCSNRPAGTIEKCSNSLCESAEASDEINSVTNAVCNLQIAETIDDRLKPSTGDGNKVTNNQGIFRMEETIGSECLEAPNKDVVSCGKSAINAGESIQVHDKKIETKAEESMASNKTSEAKSDDHVPGGNKSGAKSDDRVASNKKSRVKYDDDHVPGGNKSGAKSDEHVASNKKSRVKYDDDHVPGGNKSEAKSDDKSDEEFLTQAEAIIEHYVTEAEDDGHAMVRRVLQRAADFWMGRRLPAWRLERLLERHLDKLFYPLGLMLFSGNDGDGSAIETVSMLPHLSSKFCLQLCSALMTHVGHGKAHPEYIDLLVNAASAYGSCPAGQGEARTPEQLVEAILSKLGGSAAVPFVSLSEQVVTARLNDQNGSGGGRLFVFSCGHHYGAGELHRTALPALAARLPSTARAMRSLFDDPHTPATHLACPACVLRHVQAVAIETPI